jgi:hypothetical protein
LRDLLTNARQLIYLLAQIVVAVTLVCLAILVILITVIRAFSWLMRLRVWKWLVQVLHNHLVVPRRSWLHHELVVIVAELNRVQWLVLVLVNVVEGQNLALKQSAQEDYDLAESFTRENQPVAALAHGVGLFFEEFFAVWNADVWRFGQFEMAVDKVLNQLIAFLNFQQDLLVLSQSRLGRCLIDALTWF